MVLYCVVPGCNNTSRVPGISFHRFPPNERKKKAWCLKMKCHGKVSSAMRVCSAHFLPEDYRHISNYKKVLKDGANPSVFPYDTSVKTEDSLSFVLSMPKSRKNIGSWKPQDKIPIIIAPPLEDFLDLPMEYISKKIQENRLVPLTDKTTKLFRIKEKKNVQESSNYIPSINKEETPTSNLRQSVHVNDSKIWKWLKQTKKTKKTFINYFVSGMSPSVAIQHHESMLRFENPDLLIDNKRNPPKAWVYYLYDCWLNEKANGVSKINKPRITNDTFNKFLESNALIEVSSNNEINPVVQQKDPQAPCIIHMNNKLTDDYEDDLQHLLIPDEVKELFYKYFDDGLNVSEAMELNEENLKKDRNWPQFTPSKRVVNYIYKIWHQQIKSCDDSSRDSGFASFNENNYVRCDPSFDGLSEQTDCQNISANFVVASEPTNDPSSKESAADVLQAKTNFSLESTMEILPFPFIPQNSSSNPQLINVNNIAPESGEDLVQTKDNLFVKMETPPKVDYMFDALQDKFTTMNYQNSVTLENSSSAFVNSFDIKANNEIPAESILNETKTYDSLRHSPVTFYDEKFESNKLCFFSDFPHKYSFQAKPELSSQTTFSDAFNELRISNYTEPNTINSPCSFHPAMFDSNICFQRNTENNENEFNSFQAFADKTSETVSRMTCDFKDLSHIYSTSQLGFRTSSSLSSSPHFVNESNVVKEMPNESKMDNFIESVGSKFSPEIMNMPAIDPTNNDEISFSDDDNEECIGMNGTENLQIVPLELSKQNEDQKFLMSLLPEFECIPDCFKVILKNDILNLIHSTKLNANKKINLQI